MRADERGADGVVLGLGPVGVGVVDRQHEPRQAVVGLGGDRDVGAQRRPAAHDPAPQRPVAVGDRLLLASARRLHRADLRLERGAAQHAGQVDGVEHDLALDRLLPAQQRGAVRPPSTAPGGTTRRAAVVGPRAPAAAGSAGGSPRGWRVPRRRPRRPSALSASPDQALDRQSGLLGEAPRARRRAGRARRTATATGSSTSWRGRGRAGSPRRARRRRLPAPGPRLMRALRRGPSSSRWTTSSQLVSPWRARKSASARQHLLVEPDPAGVGVVGRIICCQTSTGSR